MRKFVIFILFLSFLWSVNANSSKDISFVWSLIYKNRTQPVKYYEGSSSLKLNKESMISFYVKPLSEVYIYILNFDSEHGFTQVFPEMYSLFTDKSYKENMIEFFIPDSDYENGYVLTGDSPALDIFYILASSERLSGLEKLIVEYNKISKDGQVINNKTLDSVQRIKDEIVYLMRLNSNLTKDTIEKPVSIAGVTKSVTRSETMKKIGIEVGTVNFYAKTIRIEH